MNLTYCNKLNVNEKCLKKKDFKSKFLFDRD